MGTTGGDRAGGDARPHRARAGGLRRRRRRWRAGRIAVTRRPPPAGDASCACPATSRPRRSRPSPPPRCRDRTSPSTASGSIPSRAAILDLLRRFGASVDAQVTEHRRTASRSGPIRDPPSARSRPVDDPARRRARADRRAAGPGGAGDVRRRRHGERRRASSASRRATASRRWSGGCGRWAPTPTSSRRLHHPADAAAHRRRRGRAPRSSAGDGLCDRGAGRRPAPPSSTAPKSRRCSYPGFFADLDGLRA